MKKRLIAFLLVLVLLIPAAVAAAASGWYRVATTSLRVRYMPSESAKVLGSYRQDYALTIESSADGWSYVKFSNGKQGYVQTSYLKKGSSYSAWITKDGTALRKGPDGSFGAKATLARGKKVTVLTHGAKYDFVNAGDLGKGYVVNSLLSKKKVASSGKASESTQVTGGNYDAWVLNAGYRKVNLRSGASTNAPVIAQYSTGTKVHVISHGGTWDQVSVSGNTGYMMTKFLSKQPPAETPVPAPKPDPSGEDNYAAYIYSQNHKPVNVRKGDSENYTVLFKVPYGARITVVKHGSKWDYIDYNGRRGYVKTSFVQLSKPDGAPDENATAEPAATPKPAFQPYNTTITSPNGKSVNFHKQAGTWSSNVDGVGRLEVGSTVKVLGMTNGWAKVEYNGHTGWVMTKYLK